jgi:hypothetical protein
MLGLVGCCVQLLCYPPLLPKIQCLTHKMQLFYYEQGGGGGGYVGTGTFSVTPGNSVTVTVGAAGNGALDAVDNTIAGNSPGGVSSFGSMLSRNGGLTPVVMNGPGANGNDPNNRSSIIMIAR